MWLPFPQATEKTAKLGVNVFTNVPDSFFDAFTDSGPKAIVKICVQGALTGKACPGTLTVDRPVGLSPGRARSRSRLVTESVAKTRPGDRNAGRLERSRRSGISKSFGGVRALHDASFAADFGEVHALVGENGAGKSTMIKILSGVLKPDEGVVRIEGDEVDLARPHDAQALGVATVFQELTLMPWMTVAENLLIGKEPRGRAAADPPARAPRRGPPRSSPRYGVAADRPARARRRAFARAAPGARDRAGSPARAARSSSSTSPPRPSPSREVEWLFGHVRALRERGACVIFTSHRWGEVVDLADRITVFRNGEYVATRESIDESEAVTLMTGRTIDRIYPDLPPVPDDAPRGARGARPGRRRA